MYNQFFNNSHTWHQNSPQQVPWQGNNTGGDGETSPMVFNHFDIANNGVISGNGSDGHSDFVVNGQAHGSHLEFIKQHPDGTSAKYRGELDHGIVRGTWEDPNGRRGTFEIMIFPGGGQPPKPQPQQPIQMPPQEPHWVGYYEGANQKSEMKLNMQVSPAGVVGVGKDQVGHFNINGECDGKSIKFVKKYHGAHDVFYIGNIFNEGNVTKVMGYWNIPNDSQGRFELAREPALDCFPPNQSHTGFPTGPQYQHEIPHHLHHRENPGQDFLQSMDNPNGPNNGGNPMGGPPAGMDPAMYYRELQRTYPGVQVPPQYSMGGPNMGGNPMGAPMGGQMGGPGSMFKTDLGNGQTATFNQMNGGGPF